MNNSCLRCFYYHDGKCVADKGSYCLILMTKV